MSKNVLLISVQTVKDRSAVHKNMDDSLILGEIKMAQDQRLVEALGSNFLRHLQDAIEAGTTTPAEDTLLEDYITDALIWFTIAGLPLGSSYQFFTKGVLQRSNEFSNTPSMSDMMSLAEHYENRGEFYRKRLIHYLKANQSDFPEFDYSSCGCGDDQDIGPKKNGYSVPTWLADD